MNKGLLQLSLAFLFAIAIVIIWFSGNTKFDQLALGTETSAYYAKNVSNEPIHISRIDNNEEPGFLKSYINSGKPKTIFFLVILKHILLTKSRIMKLILFRS